jgi:polyferredoxin
MAKPKHISPKLLALDEKVMLETRMSTVRHMTGGITSILVALVLLLLAFWTKIFASINLPFISDLLNNATFGNIITIIFVLLALLFFVYFIVRWPCCKSPPDPLTHL